MRRLTHFLIAYLVITLSNPCAYAGAKTSGGSSFSTEEELPQFPRGNEYVSASFPGAVLMKVQLLGAINRPGIHHVPTKTDILTLLSSAGGPTSDALLDEVTIRRMGKDKNTVIDLNVEDILQEADASSFLLEPNDVIFIPAKRPVIAPDVVTTVGFIASILGVAVTSILLYDRLKHPAY